jgi:hypothetical protein
MGARRKNRKGRLAGDCNQTRGLAHYPRRRPAGDGASGRSRRKAPACRSSALTRRLRGRRTGPRI